MRNDNERMTALWDERAVLRVLHQYCHTMDEGAQDAWLDLFLPDGVFEVCGPAGETLHREQGREELAGYFSRHERDRRHDKHVLVDVLIDVDAGESSAESYYLALRRADDGKPQVRAYGRYHDRLVKVDGRWRIAERRAELEAW